MYAELEPEEHQSHYFFHHFKMKLYESKKLTRETFIRDQTGKDMKAVDVYSIVLQYFNRAAMQQVGQVKNDQPVQGFSSKHILWMLSMPAIWTDYARQFMREAATNAELENVKLVLESEAGDVFAIDKQLNMRQDMFAGKFPVGHKYILADLGGGTVDICVHEVVEGRNLCELYRATGDCAEGSRVNHAFEQFFVRFVWGSSTRKFQKEISVDVIIANLKEILSACHEDIITSLLLVGGYSESPQCGMSRSEPVYEVQAAVIVEIDLETTHTGYTFMFTSGQPYIYIAMAKRDGTKLPQPR
ncbi:heat shock 70 kDa protein 12A-like [Mya arenaria]|uniref:heat shock 70 kDa protein 12A-like n=1 Tax=Mya arenaria TaxID=6604 RepID=UPI0022E6AE44|nr:heat shock 70 kDa protein 12A-like [Mya arenaria]